MGYIVDLTIVMQRLFWIMFFKSKPCSVTMDELEGTFASYNNSEEQKKVHHEIRTYADRMSFIDPANPDSTHDEVKRLIQTHRYDPLGDHIHGGG